MELYDIKVRHAQGNEVSLSEYRGKVLLIVNTATKCGFTPQYEALQSLYEKYNSKGFEILDFPCNQFGGQAPGTIAEIQEFCSLKFHTTFTQFDKIDVNGKQESPLYTYLKSQKNGIFGSAIKWNFTKFLVARDGEITARYGSDTKPQELEDPIASLLDDTKGNVC